MSNIYSIFTGKLIESSNETKDVSLSERHYNEVTNEIIAFFKLQKEGKITLEIMKLSIPVFEEYSLIAMTQEARDTARRVLKNLRKEVKRAKANF